MDPSLCAANSKPNTGGTEDEDSVEVISQPDQSNVVPVAVTTGDGVTRTYNVDPDRTTVRRLTKMAIAGQDPPAYPKTNQRMWLLNGGNAGGGPLEKSKKLSDYGIGPNQPVTVQTSSQKDLCSECWQNAGFITLFLLTCCFCFDSCACLRPNTKCNRQCCRCC